MHATMLLSGLIFFWRVLDPRPAPLGRKLRRAARRIFAVASLNPIVP
jgi:cytochrome c oxidase assembly factor CtaG